MILNSCTPIKARSYGLYLRFGDEKFKVKIMAVFSPFSSIEWIRTDAEEYLRKIKGRFEKNNLKSAFFIYKIIHKVLKAVLSNITN